MAAISLEDGEMWALNMLKGDTNQAHNEYMRRLKALEAFKELVENKYSGRQLNMETGILHSEDSPT